MNSYKKFNQVAFRDHMEGDREIYKGDILRQVAIFESDAALLNQEEESRDFLQGGQKYKYVPVEVKE